MKYALIIGNNKYDDQKLAQLKTPAADSHALAKVLDDKTIGSFDEVTPLINQTETMARRIISSFLTNKKPDDLVLLYFSGHGVLDDRGRLYLALRDTQLSLLKATSIPSSFIADEMDTCRSKRQILILDCCHSGAFERGTKGEQKAITETTFEGSGFGRVVLTASNSTQYALEGDQVIKQTELSLFTHFLLEGLKTGEADVNNDGHISLDEWYDYTYAKVISETPKQVPHKWSYNQQGDLIIAKNPYVKKRIVELPYELVQALESQFVSIRESGVTELGKYLRSRDVEMVDLAIASLERMKQDDSRRISSLAERLLSEFEQSRAPAVKVDSPKQIPEAEVKPANMTRTGSMAPPTTTAEITPLVEKRTPRPEAEKVHKPVVQSSTPQGLVFNSSFWFKWIGISVIVIIVSYIFFEYNKSQSGNGTSLPVILFTVVAGLSGLIQWAFFRNRLNYRWVAGNLATGLVLGVLHNFLYKIFDEWWDFHLSILLTVWVSSNFTLGPILIRKTLEKSTDEPTIITTGARQNTFLLLLSASLILSAAANFILVEELSDLRSSSLFFYSMAAILTGISFIRAKNVPRNFGFITLAIFMFLDGINILFLALNPNYPAIYFAPSGIMALISGIFFIFRGETWKNFGFIMLSGHLILTGLAGISGHAWPSSIFPLLALSVLFALPAAIFFLFRR